MANRTSHLRRNTVRSKRTVLSRPEPERRHATEASDDYLKAILALSGRDDQQVPASELAARLKLSGASVTKMLQKLSAETPPLLIYEKHRGVRLAPAGRERALEIVRHHRLIETFLHEVLEYPWDEVHDEAERLEHFISEQLEARIAAKLNHPAFDPHGHAIPALDGTVTPENSATLAQSRPGDRYRVVSVSDRDPEMLRYLAGQGVRPGSILKLKRELPFRGGFEVVLASAKRPALLSNSLAGAILVAPQVD